MKNSSGALAAFLLLAASPAAPQAIPRHPDELRFKPIAFTPPVAKDHRVVLKNGMVVYIAEDKTLPLVSIGLTVRTGGYLEPAGKEGLAGFTGSQIRRGGTKGLTAEQLDERLDFLAAQASTGVGDNSGSASLNCLSDNLDEALKLFAEMLREPRFQADRLQLAKDNTLQEMKKRNDETSTIEGREWSVLMYGEKHYINRFTTEASVKSITRDDLVAFHKAWFHPGNMIAAVSGSFAREDMLRKLEAAFANWPTARPDVPPVPGGADPAPPGLYRIQKDVNQGRVSIGLLSVKRDNPDIYALEVMNEILGGSGFAARITKTVRSNEGLAYSAGSGIGFGVYSPGTFRAAFQSKSRTVAYAAQLVLGEIKKMREGSVSEEELTTIKNSLVQTFPSNWASKGQAMGIFASDEYTKRDPGFWQTYRDRIQSITAAEVQRVARTYLVPEKMTILVVGDQKEIAIGDDKHPVTLESLAPGGNVKTLGLRDPMTMKMK
jgi:predicted Zn-dependent peptidase